jgi:hypothetical protein
MCKPSCCPATTSSGLSTAAAIAAVVVVTAMAAGPIATAAAHLLHALITITIITLATLAALAATITATVLIIRRTRRAPEHRAPITIAASTHQSRHIARAAPAALHAPPTAGFCLTPGERARCQALGADPDQVAQIITTVLEGPS